MVLVASLQGSWFVVRGSWFVTQVTEASRASVIGHLFEVENRARVIVRNQDYISVHNGGSFLLCQAETQR